VWVVGGWGQGDTMWLSVQLDVQHLRVVLGKGRGSRLLVIITILAMEASQVASGGWE
jgi:hypothetical protein